MRRKTTTDTQQPDPAVDALAEEALAVMEQAAQHNGEVAHNGLHAGPGAAVIAEALGVGTAEEAASEPATEVQAQDDLEIRAILEAILFVSAEPLTVERCVAVLGQVAKADVRRALGRMEQDYRERTGALQLVQVAGGYRLVTRPEYASWIRRLEKAKSQAKLSRSAIEALAIIAYRQPVVRGELEKIRGVETSGVIRTLLERKLVRIVGRKDEPGRPIMYGTTKQFLEHFGLKDLAELPPLREFKELGEGDQASLLEDAVMGPAESQAVEGVSDDQMPVESIEGSHHDRPVDDEIILPMAENM